MEIVISKSVNFNGKFLCLIASKGFFFYTGLFGYATWRLLIVQKVKEGVDCTRTT